MKLSWGMGELVVILFSIAVYLFFPALGVSYTISLLLLLSGLWTLANGVFFVEKKDRNYYVSWGVVIAVLSAFAFLPANYALGLVLIAVVALILFTAYTYRSGKMYTAATSSPPAPGGETPAASQRSD
jgi:hypothetical protein